MSGLKDKSIYQIPVFIAREFLAPTIYLTGIAVGTLVVLLMGTFSLVPYVVPIIIQALSRGAIKYGKRLEGQLAQVPALRPDPTFIMDHRGGILLSAGVTNELFRENNIQRLQDFTDQEAAVRILEGTKSCREEQAAHTAFSPVLNRHYEVSMVPAETGCRADADRFVVWFKDITPRMQLVHRQKKLLSYFNDLLENIREVSRNRNLNELLAEHILDAYGAVFIARSNADGEITGNVFKQSGNGLEKSAEIVIDPDNHAPIRLSMSREDVVLDYAADPGEIDEFNARYKFHPRVKEFIGEPVSGFINYHQGDVVVIAFNPRSKFTGFDSIFFETLVSVSRSIFFLANLARINDEKSRQTVMGLSAAAEFSDEITGKHILRVGEYSGFLAGELGYDQNFVEDIILAAPLHDMGKVAMPELIKYQGKYDDEMRRKMQMHTIIGANILGRMIRFSENPEKWLVMAYNIALHHHQMYNGEGYPCSRVLGVQPGDLSVDPDDYQGCAGISGDQIPLEALIVGLADRYDALRSPRQYKPEFSHNKAMQIMEQDDRLGVSGPDWYGPGLWQAFMNRHEEMADIYSRMRD